MLPKHAVALLIRHPHEEGRILVVQRPDGPGEDLPGIWGLPAATCQPGEGLEEAARRAARQKLGLTLQALHPLTAGTQERLRGLLSMTIYQAAPQGSSPTLPDPSQQTDGSTHYTGWRWAPLAILEEGAAQGSLCCALALAHGEGEQHREDVPRA